MAIETSIHSQNTVLARLKDTRGAYCGEEVIKRAINSELFVLLGEPAVGKSTIAAQVAHELAQRQISFEVVAYDNVLADFIAKKGIHEEGPEFNATLINDVLQARKRMSKVGGVVIFDTCAVGNKSPKDRSVSAVEELIHLAKVGNPFFSKISIMSVIGSYSSQLRHARLRYELLTVPSPLVITLLRMYDIHLHDLPPHISRSQVGDEIKATTRRTATAIHIAKIAREVTHNDLQVITDEGPRITQAIDIPHEYSRRDALHLQLRVAGLRDRIDRLGLTEEQWLTAINVEQNGPIIWYSTNFLRRYNIQQESI